MDLQEVRKILTFVLKDKGVQTYVPVDHYNGLLDLCNNLQFKKKLGIPEQYSPGMPVPREVVEITQKNMGDLRPFKKVLGERDHGPLIVDKFGYTNIPSDFVYYTSLYYFNTEDGVTSLTDIDVVTDKQWSERVSHAIEYPDRDYPICNIVADKVRFMPKDLRQVLMTYYRWPAIPFYSYIYDSDKKIFVYDSASSTQLEWDAMNIYDIIILMLEFFGIKMTAQDLVQFSDQKIKEGV